MFADRQIVKQHRDHFDRFTACGWNPAAVLAEFLDGLKFEIAGRVVDVLSSSLISHHGNPATVEHLHHQRRAGSRKT
ncbi:MAG: hypothetical protein ACK55I_50430 [bacterium]